jgi:electron transport complex protein RnfG
MSYIVKLALILGLICAVAAGALAYTNEMTYERIAGQIEQAKQDALRAVLPGADSFRLEPELLAAAQAKDASLRVVTEMYTGQGDSGQVGTAYVVTVTGYGGPITLMAGVGPFAITGVKIVEASNETPGLGAKIKDPAFQAQFAGKTFAGPLLLVKNATSAEDEVQAVTAATLSSSAVLRAVNAATGVYSLAVGGVDRQLAKAKEDAAKEIFPGADAIVADPERLQAAQAANPQLAAVNDLYVVKSGETVVGTAVTATAEGYGGPIVALVGFGPPGTIAGVRFVKLSGETAGLGSRVAQAAFTAQFAGKAADTLRLVKTSPGAGEVQAVSGATYSSAGAVDAVNAAIGLYIQLGRP